MLVAVLFEGITNITRKLLSFCSVVVSVLGIVKMLALAMMYRYIKSLCLFRTCRECTCAVKLLFRGILDLLHVRFGVFRPKISDDLQNKNYLMNGAACFQLRFHFAIAMRLKGVFGHSISRRKSKNCCTYQFDQSYLLPWE